MSAFVGLTVWLTQSAPATREPAVARATSAEAGGAEPRGVAAQHAIEIFNARQTARDRERLSVSKELETQWLEAERLELEQDMERARREEAAAAREGARLLAQRRGEAAFEEGRNVEALAAYDEAVWIDPRHPGCWESRGVVLGRLERYGDSITSCDEALRLRPKYVEALVTRANAYRLRGDADSARRDLDAALAVDPKHLTALENRALVRRLAGDALGAREDRRAAQVLISASEELGLFIERRRAKMTRLPVSAEDD